MINLQEARAKIQELAGHERRVMGGSLIHRGGRFGFGSETFEPSDDFKFKLCELIKVPLSVFDRCSPELQSHMLAEFAAGEDKYSIIVRGDKADSIGRFRDLFIPIPNIFDTLVANIGGNVEFETIKLDRGMYEIEAVTDVIHASPKAGDVSRGGVLVQVGQFLGLNYRFSVSSYIQRLVCSNGLTRRESLSTMVVKKLGSEGDALRHFGTLVSQTLAQVSSRYLPEFADTVNHRVEDPTAVLRVMAKEMGVQEDLTNGLLDLVPTLPAEATMYDVINLTTSYANLHPYARRRLQNVGGRLVDQSVQRCDHCHRAL